MIRRRHRLLLSSLPLLGLLLALPAWSSSHLGAEARTFMVDFYKRLDQIVVNPDAGAALKRSQVIRELNDHLDWGYLAAAALGKQSEKFSREQFASFSHEYNRFLNGIFLNSIAAGEPETPRLLDVTEKGENVLVRTARPARKGYQPGGLLLPKASPEGLVMSYGLRKRNGAWRIRSVAFGGVDVSRTFRGQFDSFLQGSDPDALVAELRKRNAAADQKNPFAPKAK